VWLTLTKRKNRKKFTLEQLEIMKKYPYVQYVKELEKKKAKARKHYYLNQKKILNQKSKYRESEEYKEWRRQYREAENKLQRMRNPLGKKQRRCEKIAEKLPLGEFCEFCGKVEGLLRHHPDYNLPEIYVTCCCKCHKWLHVVHPNRIYFF